MWTRRELKGNARIALKANYWTAVIVGIINSVFVIGAGSATYKSSKEEIVDYSDEISSALMGLNEEEIAMLCIAVGVAILGIVAVATLFSTLIKIFVQNPLGVGVNSFFTKCVREDDAEIKDVLNGFKHSYGNVVLGLFLKDLFVFLWTLLFIIPGIIMAYSWMMVPYILADNPMMSPREARALSAQMMRGNKWKTFVLQFSFIGWAILATITGGIVKVFYLDPYFELTTAGLYQRLREAN